MASLLARRWLSQVGKRVRPLQPPLSRSFASTLSPTPLQLDNSEDSSGQLSNFITPSLLNTLEPKVQTVETIYPVLQNDFELQSGAKLPRDSIQIKYATFGKPSLNKPIILLCPSMSNSVFAMDEESDEKSQSSNRESGWWRGIVGPGANYGIDTDKFFVICGAPLGSPFGSTSPLTNNPNTGKPWGPTFPQITPRDQANVQALLLDSLGIKKVFAVIGGSMGGMQSLQFAVNHPNRYDLFASIAATGQTSPGIVALRSVQRAAVRTDPKYEEGYYYLSKTTKDGPVDGMRVARMFGTICYRSHAEFTERFQWYPSRKVIRKNNDEFEVKDVDYTFDVENYLRHQGDRFVTKTKYDANCWLLNSKSMDLMDVGGGSKSYDDAIAQISEKNCGEQKQALLLSYSTDRLTPPEDLERFSSVLGKNKIPNYYEILESKYGHDAFLIDREAEPLNLRLRAFLEGGLQKKRAGATDSVHKLVRELFHH